MNMIDLLDARYNTISIDFVRLYKRFTLFTQTNHRRPLPVQP